MTIRAETMRFATDLADYLVKLGIVFRDAHKVLGRAVSHSIAAGCGMRRVQGSGAASQA